MLANVPEIIKCKSITANVQFAQFDLFYIMDINIIKQINSKKVNISVERLEINKYAKKITKVQNQYMPVGDYEFIGNLNLLDINSIDIFKDEFSKMMSNDIIREEVLKSIIDYINKQDISIRYYESIPIDFYFPNGIIISTEIKYKICTQLDDKFEVRMKTDEVMD